MNRRSILKSLGILPIGLLTPKFVTANNESKELRIGDTIYSCEEYKDFKYFWRGWIQTPDSIRIVGQWIAVNVKDNINIYSASTGISGQFCRGESFSLTLIAPRQHLDETSSEELKNKQKHLALISLKMEIDKYYAEIKNPPKNPEYKFGFTGFEYTKNSRIYNISA